jgi:hypothetical protein
LRTAGPQADPREAKARLKAQLERLPIVPDADLRAAGKARLETVAALDDVSSDAALATALASARLGMLDDVEAAPEDPAVFGRWRIEIVTLYEQWIDRFARR